MNQSITGVTPPEIAETTVMIAWPSLGATAFGQTLGGLFAIRAGVGNILTIGNLLALVTIPITLPLYFLNLLPWSTRRYRLTNRRVVVERGLRPQVVQEVSLANFDDVQVVVHPGQEWYPCGDLIFMKGNVETFRLFGVRHPESFMKTCLKTQRGYAGVSRAVKARA